MNTILSIINGGLFKGKKTYITTGVGIISAIGAFFVGDLGLIDLLQTVFPLAGIFFLRSSIAK